jgi:hypothetical protein
MQLTWQKPNGREMSLQAIDAEGTSRTVNNKL